MDNMTLEFYKKIYNTKIQKYKSMYLIKTENEVLLVKNGYGQQGFSYYDDKLYDDNKEYDYAKWRRDAWRLGSLDNSNIGRRLFRFISAHADRYEGIIDTDNMFDKYIGRCPDNNNVGYYFALRDRLSHHI